MNYKLIWEQSKTDKTWYGRGHWPFVIEYWINSNGDVQVNDNNSFIKSFDNIYLKDWAGDIERTKINCNEDYKKRVKVFIRDLKHALDNI